MFGWNLCTTACNDVAARDSFVLSLETLKAGKALISLNKGEAEIENALPVKLGAAQSTFQHCECVTGFCIGALSSLKCCACVLSSVQP